MQLSSQLFSQNQSGNHWLSVWQGKSKFTNFQKPPLNFSFFTLSRPWKWPIICPKLSKTVRTAISTTTGWSAGTGHHVTNYGSDMWKVRSVAAAWSMLCSQPCPSKIKPVPHLLWVQPRAHPDIGYEWRGWPCWWSYTPGWDDTLPCTSPWCGAARVGHHVTGGQSLSALPLHITNFLHHELSSVNNSLDVHTFRMCNLQRSHNFQNINSCLNIYIYITEKL